MTTEKESASAAEATKTNPKTHPDHNTEDAWPPQDLVKSEAMPHIPTVRREALKAYIKDLASTDEFDAGNATSAMVRAHAAATSYIREHLGKAGGLTPTAKWSVGEVGIVIAQCFGVLSVCDFNPSTDRPDRDTAQYRFYEDARLTGDVESIGVYKRVNGAWLMRAAGELGLGDFIKSTEALDDLFAQAGVPQAVFTRPVRDGAFPLRSGVLVPVEGPNGMDFTWATVRRYEPFSEAFPYVFKGKAGGDFRPTLESPRLPYHDGNGHWEVHEWLNEITNGDEQNVRSLWETIAMAVKPGVVPRRMCLLIGEHGSGKGTFMDLLGHLHGGGTTRLTLSALANEFVIGSLADATLNLGDDTDVSAFNSSRIDLFKSIITGDAVTFNRKFEQPVTARPTVLWVQAANEMPKMSDSSSSVADRLHFIELTKTFRNVEGVDRREIKDEFIKQQDVLDYLTTYAFMHYGTVDRFTETDDAGRLRGEFSSANNSVYEFCEEVLERLEWPVYWTALLYRMYKGWLKQTNPRAGARKQAMFVEDLARWVGAHPTSKQWVFEPKKRMRRSQIYLALAYPDQNPVPWDDTISELCEDIPRDDMGNRHSKIDNLIPNQPTGILSSPVIAQEIVDRHKRTQEIMRKEQEAKRRKEERAAARAAKKKG